MCGLLIPNTPGSINQPTTAPQLESATYRFTAITGSVHIVEDTFLQPNGIAISPDLSIICISDTGAKFGPIDGRLGSLGTIINATGKRTTLCV
ncbi:hypothetical protein ABVK25_000429 [Lepraria finkii]|uniref:Uncharacterized protein n=1 Tax=Lepraria finkii TaxID=1340010 RepID=A0ABR4BMV7_9LECA